MTPVEVVGQASWEIGFPDAQKKGPATATGPNHSTTNASYFAGCFACVEAAVPWLVDFLFFLFFAALLDFAVDFAVEVAVELD
jgi:hypothetical protein